MPPRMQMPRAPQVSAHHFADALTEVFLYIGLSAAVFTRRRFGYRAISPLKLVFAAALFWGYHDFIFPLLAQSFEPPLLASPSAEIFCLGIVAFALFHFVEGYAAHRSGDERHTYFTGEPWLALAPGLRNGAGGYWLSVALDIVAVGIAGFFLAYLDAALGLWLVVAAASLAGLTLRGLKQLRRDVADMRDAGVHAGIIGDRTPTPAPSMPRPAKPAGRSGDAEEVSTGATRRR